jgi:hypothetical protein
MYENRRARTANPEITARHELNSRLAVHRRHISELQPYVALARLEPREDEMATLLDRLRIAHTNFLRETEGLDDVDGMLTDLHRSFARVEEQLTEYRATGFTLERRRVRLGSSRAVDR